MEFWNANCEDELLRTAAMLTGTPEAELASAELQWVDQVRPAPNTPCSTTGIWCGRVRAYRQPGWAPTGPLNGLEH